MKTQTSLWVAIIVVVWLYGALVFALLYGLVPSVISTPWDRSSMGPHPVLDQWWAPFVGVPSFVCMIAFVMITLISPLVLFYSVKYRIQNNKWRHEVDVV